MNRAELEASIRLLFVCFVSKHILSFASQCLEEPSVSVKKFEQIDMKRSSRESDVVVLWILNILLKLFKGIKKLWANGLTSIRLA